MSDQKKPTKSDELVDIRSLIGDAKAGSFSLDDILAEYGSGKEKGKGAVPVRGKVLSFPTQPSPPKQAEQDEAPPSEEEAEAPDEPTDEEEPEDDDEAAEEEAPSSEEDETEDDAPEDDEDAEQTDGPRRVIPFPEEESMLSAFLKKMTRRADHYADHMFEEDEATDPEEVKRLEKLIPGTDWEEPEPPKAPSFFRRRPPKVEPPPEDTDPRELARAYGKGLKGMRLRVILLFLLSAAALVQLLVPALGLVWLPPLDQLLIQRAASAGLMGLGVLLAADGILGGLSRAFHGRVGMDTLAALAALSTLMDGVLLLLLPEDNTRLPYSAAALAGLFLLLHGTYHKRCAARLSCRTAAASSHPYRVTLDEGKWNGRDTYTKWTGTAQGFGSQIQMDDGAQRIFRRVCPLLLTADVLLALLIALSAGRPEKLPWCLSALFTVTSAFGGALVYGRPFHKVARRLSGDGAALAGWPGVAGSRRGDRVLLTDTDLFPPGYVELNGFKVLNGYPMERVVAYTATLIRDSGSGLTKLFHDYLRTLGGLMRTAERLCCYEGGGLSATIRGDQVLVGSAAFMNLMEISLPAGLNVKNAVFCAINGDLAGIFALNYSLPDTVFPALEALLGEKLSPVLATRDFNVIPAMLHQRFKLAADKMDFPPVERRRELSDPDQPHGETLTALLCREGLLPFAESITAAKRLRWAARLGAILCCAGSVLGLLLASYLTSVDAYTSLSPLNLLVYLILWLLPVWFLTGWVHRY